jgi:AcrR family transcriptional regulator
MSRSPHPVSRLRNGRAGATPPRRRMTAAQRRQQLLAEAVRLFASHGFSGTTTKAIAEAGGVSEAIIFRHFKDKKGLFAAIVREKARQDGYDQMLETLQVLAKQGDDEGLVFHLALRTLQRFGRDPDFHRLMLYAALEKPGLAKVSRRILGMPLFRLLRRYVIRRQKEGAFRVGRPEHLAFGMMALPMHFVLVTKVLGARKVRSSDEELASTFTRMILDGMRVEQNAPVRTGNREGSRVSSAKPLIVKQESFVSQNRAEGAMGRLKTHSRINL